MIDREQLRAIAALRYYENALQANNLSFEIYVSKLNEFIDALPVHEEEAKTALIAKDINKIHEHITAVWDMLVQIHADKLAEDCHKKIDELRTMGKTQLETYIENFFSTVLSLSIDIQLVLSGMESRKIEEDKKEEDEKKARYILAVDDSAFALNTLKTCLKDTHYKLTCVLSGNDALKFLNDSNVDLIILDIDMPEMDGYETAQKIRKLGRRIPIIFLTGNARKEYVSKAMQVGAVDFIVKPINREIALEKIARYAR